MKIRMIAMVLASCTAMTAQISNYLGPGILSRGAGDIGTRSGQDVDLRFFVNAAGIYDNGVQPYSVDGTGHLVTVNGLWGTEVSFGAYGVHNFHHARLGLDYGGSYRHYSQNSFYDGTDQMLALGYTYQKSQRLVFDLRQMAGTASQATSFAGALPVLADSVVTPASLLFDNRVNYLQSGMDVNYLASDRTTLTVGGEGFGVWRKAPGLAGMQGYQLHGTIQRRITRRTTLAASYQHAHYDFPKAFGQSDIDSYSATFATQLSRFWTASVQGGVTQAEVQGLQQVAVDPEIAALLGVAGAVQTFYQKTTFPQYGATLGRRFQHAALTFQYSSGVSGGNGVYLTSRQDTGSATFSYTATHKWNLSMNAGYSRLNGIGQGLQPYSQVIGGASATYSITNPIHLLVNYTARHQEITNGVYLQDSYRASVGISFSPGDVPLAFH